MPTDYRAELHSLRAEHGDLVRRFEVLTTEHARTLRDRRNTVSQLLRVKRDNMLLAAALRGKAGAVAAMASHAMWQKEAAVLELKMARWQVADQVELVLRYLYRAKRLAAPLERLERSSSLGTATEVH